MKEEIPYSNRELDEKFQSVAQTSTRNATELAGLITRNDKDYRESLSRIELQTEQHNHRMTKMEGTLLVLGTAVVILVALKVPAVAGLFSLAL